MMAALQMTVGSLTDQGHKVVWNLYFSCSYAAALNILVMMFLSMTQSIPNIYKLFKEKNVQFDLVGFVGNRDWQSLRLHLALDSKHKKEFCKAMKESLILVK